MASNQRKEQIRVEWSTNYQNAIQQIEQVKKSVSDNATEMENLNRIQQQLEDNFKGFEKTLDFVAKQTKDNEYANQKLTEAISKLEKQISDVDKKMNTLNASLQDVAKSNDKVADSVDEVSKANDKASKSIDKSKDSTKDLSDTNKDLAHTTQSTNDTTAQSSVLFQRLDEVTFGLASNFRDLVESNGGVKQAIQGNAADFDKMTKSAKASTVAINVTKLALKTLLIAGGIGLIVIAFQEIVENWDKINKAITYAFNPSAKLRDIELDKLKNTREQGSTIDKNTERLKRQGKSEIEILKLKRLEQAKITSAILEEIRIRREDEIKSVTFMKTLKRNTNTWLGDVKIVIGDIAKLLGAKEWGENLIKSGQKNKFLDSVTDSQFDESEEGKQLLEALDQSREAEARIANEIAGIYKRNGEEAKQRENERIERIKELNKLLKDTVDDIAVLEADTLFSKMGADWNKRTTEIEKQREDSLKKIEEAYKRHNGKLTADDKARIEESNRIINEKSDLELKVIEKEQESYRQSKLSFYELQSVLDDGNLTLEQKQKQITQFLDTIENADIKDQWTKILGIENIESSIAFMEQFKDEMQDFTIDDSASFNDNANKLQSIKDFNLSLLDEERATALARADELELSEENRLKIIEKFKKQQNEIESNYNEASKELNVKRATQISEYADVASQGLGALGSLMSENFEANKAFAVADAVINTFSAINGTLASMSSTNPYLAIATSIAIGLQGFANVVSILKTTPENASAQSAPAMANLEGAKNQPNVSFQQSGESQLAQTINNQNNDPIKAFVVAKDVTSQQEKDNIKKNNSSL